MNYFSLEGKCDKDLVRPGSWLPPGLPLTVISSFRRCPRHSGSTVLEGSGFFEINAYGDVLLATLTNQRIIIVQKSLLLTNC